MWSFMGNFVDRLRSSGYRPKSYRRTKRSDRFIFAYSDYGRWLGHTIACPNRQWWLLATWVFGELYLAVRWNSELSDEHRRRGRIKQEFRTHCALMKLVEGRARLRVGPGDCRGEGWKKSRTREKKRGRTHTHTCIFLYVYSGTRESGVGGGGGGGGGGSGGA